MHTLYVSSLMVSQHEWAVHGTCYHTLEPSCLPSGSPTGAEAVAFFQQVVALFQSLPTYTWLANGGITPSTTQTYTLSDVNSALKVASGGVRLRPAGPTTRHYTNSVSLQFTPAIGCSGHTINSISWYFNLRGSLLDGTFVPIGMRTIPQYAGPCVDSLQYQTLRRRVNVHQAALHILQSLRAVQPRMRNEKVLRRTCVPFARQRLHEKLCWDYLRC